MSEELADKIATVSIQHYLSLPGKSGKPTNPSEWTLMSSIVLETGNKDLKVVSLGTGSKCLGKNELSKDGGLVADSHAEVLARRALLLYLYGQIHLLQNQLESDVFSKVENGKAFLKSDVRFHFFTSHTPCGDASIIPKDEPPCKVARLSEHADVHRTGAKCVPGARQDPKLAGCEYHVVQVVRTKPGRGDPTASLSCSDKLAKWSAVGVQGALLSLLLDRPVFLASIVLPSNCPYSEASLRRAVVFRLPENCTNFPKFFRSSVPFPHCKLLGGKPCPTSLLWSDSKHFLGGNKSLEVAVDGRKHGLGKSKALTKAGRLKVCKAELAVMFKEVAAKLCVKVDDCNTYRDLKDKANLYNSEWKSIREIAFPEWPEKDKTFEQFCV
ncbi:tRNA-specific adenosine deaminase 1-like isoform X1 [Cloeon dipterum]|uniref:tRNA-specific adenosine deaminase 1-like isoform X1 n=1 Tax=Cloeon dipterum TaxID=197152 RepID=UPI00321F63B1